MKRTPDILKVLSALLGIGILTVAKPAAPFAQSAEPGTSLTYTEYFDINSCEIEKSPALRQFQLAVDSLVSTQTVGNVSVTGYSSVDGPSWLNERLAGDRALAMKRWIGDSTEINFTQILLFSEGEDWSLFRSLVEADASVPSKSQVLRIIGSEGTPETKDAQLKGLDNGRVWNYLVRNIFPKMRKAVVDLQIVPKAEPVAVEEVALAVVEEPLMEVVEVEKIVYVEKPECLSNRVALKTNLLYDAILMPSIEFEYKFNDRWSLAVEGNIAWWSKDSKHKYYQIMTLVPEVKFHFNPEKHWGGHYLGLFVGGGKYDLENGGKGRKGEGAMLGVSYNYNWSITDNFGIEAGLGVGGMFTRYKEYVPKNGEYVYQKTKNLWYGGPLRVKLALVWKLWTKSKCKESEL